MTCRTMRFRLRPWVWERIECPELVTNRSSGARILRKLDIITKTLFADTSLATSVRYLITVPYPWVGADPCPPQICDGVRDVE